MEEREQPLSACLQANREKVSQETRARQTEGKRERERERASRGQFFNNNSCTSANTLCCFLMQKPLLRLPQLPMQRLAGGSREARVGDALMMMVVVGCGARERERREWNGRGTRSHRKFSRDEQL